MGVLFCDIRNFVSLTESFTSSECFNFINSYLKTVIPPVIENGGTIYQILGDGILALFPPATGECSDNGLDAAIDIQRAIKKYNEGRKKAGYADVTVGIGLAYGDVALGVSGTSVQMAASAFGRTVNLASRLQDMTKIFQVDILLSKATFEHLSSGTRYHIRRVGELFLKGFSEKEVIFENFDSNEDDTIAEKLNHQEALMETFDHLEAGRVNEARSTMTTLLFTSELDLLPQSILRYLDNPQSQYFQKV